MGEDKFEYGTLNDFAYTSAHGCTRGILSGRPSPAARLEKKARKARQKAEATWAQGKFWKLRER